MAFNAAATFDLDTLSSPWQIADAHSPESDASNPNWVLNAAATMEIETLSPPGQSADAHWLESDACEPYWGPMLSPPLILKLYVRPGKVRMPIRLRVMRQTQIGVQCCRQH